MNKTHLFFIIIIAANSVIWLSFSSSQFQPYSTQNGRNTVSSNSISPPKYKFQQSKNNFLHACSFAKNSGKFISEWITFHKLMGIGSFSIYEDDSSLSSEHLNIVLADYIKDNLVNIIKWPPTDDKQIAEMITGNYTKEFRTIMEECKKERKEEECNNAAIMHCIETNRNKEWVLIMKNQNFVFPDSSEQHSSHMRTLEHILEDNYSNCSSVVVPAFTFNNVSQPNGDLVIEKYLTRSTSRSEDLYLTFLKPKSILSGDIQIGTSNSSTPSLFPHSNLILQKKISNNKMEQCKGSSLRLHHYQYKLPSEYTSIGTVVDVNALYVIPHLREALAIRALDCPSCKFTDVDPKLFEMHNHLTPHDPDKLPQLCVALLSCRRIGYLRQTIKSIINYIEKIEPWLTYEIVLVDNGSDQEMVKAILEEFPIEKVALMRKNYGITVGINLAFQGLCQAPYVLSIEDDWEARWTNWDEKVPALSMSMSILEHDPKVLEVWLRDISHEHPVHQNRDKEWNFIEAAGNVPRVQYKRQYQGTDTVWGVYTNGASLKRKSSLEQIGKMTGIDGEEDYAKVTGELGWSCGIMCLKSQQCDDQYARTSADSGLFYHIGHVRSPGRVDFKGKTWND